MSKTNRLTQKKKALLQALEASLGVVSEACKTVGIARTQFYKYCKDDPTFQAEVKAIEENTLDFVESALYNQIKEGNTTAIIFYLKTKGKKRGYVERTEVTGIDGSPVIKLVRFNEEASSN
jgi:hypothetical protein